MDAAERGGKGGDFFGVNFSQSFLKIINSNWSVRLLFVMLLLLISIVVPIFRMVLEEES